MLGAAGALCCLAAGIAAGSWMRERRLARWRMLAAEIDALGGMRLLLEQERPALTELVNDCVGYVSIGCGAEQVAKRFKLTSQLLTNKPLLSIADAYASACLKVYMPWEKQEERMAMEMLFRQLGCGTASMREQAAAACIRRLRPLADQAHAEAEKGGRLCMQLGMLLGLMAGIVLW